MLLCVHGAQCMNTGQLIRKWRIARELSQVTLGELVGVPQTHVSAWEVGRTEASFKSLERVAKAFGVTIHEFLKGPR